MSGRWTHLFSSPPRGLIPRTAILEGQAEAGRFFASLETGLLDAKLLSAELSRMANSCLLSVGSGAVNADTQLERGKTPYDCGGVLYTLGIWEKDRKNWQRAIAQDCSATGCVAAS